MAAGSERRSGGLEGGSVKKLHIWQHSNLDQVSRDFVPVTVTQIISADTFMAQFPDGHEERFSLSSIRPPRLRETTKQTPSQKKNESGKKDTLAQASSKHVESPWARETKEFLREKMIGKQVELMYEYKIESKSPAMIQKGLSTQKFATVLVEKENVAVALVGAGLAEVIPHRKEELKSVAYLELKRAQEKAKKS